MTTPGLAGAAPVSVKIAGAATLENRFLLTSVAFLRAKQLQSGARPRLEAERHKPTQLALLEVLADTISWSVDDPHAANKVVATEG